VGDSSAIDRASRLTWANALSCARLAAAPVCAWAVAGGHHGVALALYVFAVASDFVDGPLARRRGETSAFGGLLDHLSDATFVSLGLGACALRGLVPPSLAIFVALAFAQYALDSRSLSGRPLRASFLGRWNGIAYYVLLGVPVIRDGFGLGWPADTLVMWAGWALLVSTLFSMLDRGWALLRG